MRDVPAVVLHCDRVRAVITDCVQELQHQLSHGELLGGRLQRGERPGVPPVHHVKARLLQDRRVPGVGGRAVCVMHSLSPRQVRLEAVQRHLGRGVLPVHPVQPRDVLRVRRAGAHRRHRQADVRGAEVQHHTRRGVRTVHLARSVWLVHHRGLHSGARSSVQGVLSVRMPPELLPELYMLESGARRQSMRPVHRRLWERFVRRNELHQIHEFLLQQLPRHVRIRDVRGVILHSGQETQLQKLQHVRGGELHDPAVLDGG